MVGNEWIAPPQIFCKIKIYKKKMLSTYLRYLPAQKQKAILLKLIPHRDETWKRIENYKKWRQIDVLFLVYLHLL